jgi:hypothetical protein
VNVLRARLRRSQPWERGENGPPTALGRGAAGGPDDCPQETRVTPGALAPVPRASASRAHCALCRGGAGAFAPSRRVDQLAVAPGPTNSGGRLSPRVVRHPGERVPTQSSSDRRPNRSPIPKPGRCDDSSVAPSLLVVVAPRHRSWSSRHAPVPPRSAPMVVLGSNLTLIASASCVSPKPGIEEWSVKVRARRRTARCSRWGRARQGAIPARGNGTPSRGRRVGHGRDRGPTAASNCGSSRAWRVRRGG